MKPKRKRSRFKRQQLVTIKIHNLIDRAKSPKREAQLYARLSRIGRILDTPER